jgi:DNA gyrase subunit A
MRLYQLTGLERDKVEAEYLEVIKLINYLRDLLASPARSFGVIKDDLLDLRKAYADRAPHGNRARRGRDQHRGPDRRPQLRHHHQPHRLHQARARQHLPPAARGGKGVIGMGTKDEDYVEHVFMASTHDYILFFTENGRVHWQKVYEIPEGGRATRGKAIVNLLQIGRRKDRRDDPRARVQRTTSTSSWPPTAASSRRPTCPRSATRAPAASSPSTSRRATADRREA